MKEIGPIAGIDHKNTMTEINHAEGRNHQGITKLIMKESIIIHFSTMEIRENIKRVIKTSIGMKISMIVIDLTIWIILIVETGHIVETDCETTVEMSIRRNIINIREGLEIIMKMSMRTGTVGMNMNTDTEMKPMISVEIDLEKNSMNAMQGKSLTFQNLN